jgi:hypothetical protein
VYGRRARLSYGVAAVRDAQPGDPPALRFWHEGRQRWCVKGAFHQLLAAGQLVEPNKVSEGCSLVWQACVLQALQLCMLVRQYAICLLWQAQQWAANQIVLSAGLLLLLAVKRGPLRQRAHNYLAHCQHP